MCSFLLFKYLTAWNHPARNLGCGCLSSFEMPGLYCLCGIKAKMLQNYTKNIKDILNCQVFFVIL